MKTFRQTQKIHHQGTCTERNIEGSFPSKRKIGPDENLQVQKGMKRIRNSIWVNTKDFPSPIKISKLYLLIEAKIIKLFTLALSEYTGNI